MLFTKNLEEDILYAPALTSGYACNVLKIVTGFTDCDRIVSHLVALKDGIKEKKYASGIKVNIILGMTKGSSLTRRKHEKIKETIVMIKKSDGFIRRSFFICLLK